MVFTVAAVTELPERRGRLPWRQWLSGQMSLSGALAEGSFVMSTRGLESTPHAHTHAKKLLPHSPTDMRFIL